MPKNVVVDLTKLSIQVGSVDNTTGATALVTPPTGTIAQQVYNAGVAVAYINVAATATTAAGGFIGKPLNPGETVTIPTGQTLKAVTASGTTSLAVTAWGG